MKNLKKFGSAFLAGTMLLSSFAVSAYAQDSTDDIKYLINDDFSDFELVPTGTWVGGKDSTPSGWKNTETNNGIDNWRIEGNNENSGIGDYVTKADKNNGSNGETLLNNALRLSRMMGSNIYGARVWNDNIGAGDTLTIEYKVWVGDKAEFGIGLVDESRTITTYEDNPNAYLFYVLEDNSTLLNAKYHLNYVDANSYEEWDKIDFKKNEVNDVKIEITMNDDVSSDTDDTIKMTVINSAGTTSQSKTHRFRSSNGGSNPKICSIKGISFQSRRTTDKTYTDEEHAVYLDDVKVYKSQPSDTKTLINEDFSNGYGNWKMQGNDGYKNVALDGWVEAPKDLVVENDGSESTKLMDGAFYAGENETAETERKAFLRMRRDFDNKEIVGAGESFTAEFDIYADEYAKLSVTLVGANDNDNDLTPRSTVFFAYSTEYTNGKSTQDVFHSTTQSNATAGANANKYNGLIFKRNEVNHVKIDYVVNEDMSAGKKDSATVTLTNSEGTASVTGEMDFRNSEVSNPLNGIKGITIEKMRVNKSGVMYIDNIKITKHVTVPTAEITADLNADGNSSATVTFSEEMTADGIKDVFVKDNLGNKVTLGEGTLDSTGKIYTLPITGTLTAGTAYSVVVPATVTDKLGNRMQASTSKSFIAQTAKSSITQNITDNKGADYDLLRITAVAEKDYAEKTINVLVAGYDADGKLVSVKKDSFKGADGYTALKGMTKATTYKAFLWDAQSGKPLCAEAK